MIDISIVERLGRTGTEVLNRLFSLPNTSQCAGPVLLRCVFHIPGSIESLDFDGIRVYRYYKKYGYLLVEIAVPNEYFRDDNAFNRNPDFLQRCKSFIMDSVRESVRLASEYFKKRKMPFDEKAAYECVNLMDREMTMEKMKEAVAPPRIKPPSRDLLARVKKVTGKKSAE